MTWNSLPKDFVVSPKNQGDNRELDSDANPILGGKTQIIKLEDGKSDMSWDMGIHKKSSDEEKKFCIGDFVWNDANKNGIQDAGEKGVGGVKIKLLPTNKTVTTDGNGHYNFCDLKAGDYTISVNKNPIKDYVITKQDVGNDESKDSDVDPNSGKSSTISVKDGNVTAVDIGIYKKSSDEEKKFCIGDFVWNDANKNGIQDAGEKGVGGVKIKLLPTNKTVTTDGNGHYNFCDLKAGDYTISVNKNPIKDYVITKQDVEMMRVKIVM